MQYKKKGIQKPMNKKKNNNNSHGKKKAQNKDKFSKNGNYLFNSRTRSPKRGQDITTTQSSPQK
jgi:hypothetical protein